MGNRNQMGTEVRDELSAINLLAGRSRGLEYRQLLGQIFLQDQTKMRIENRELRVRAER